MNQLLFYIQNKYEYNNYQIAQLKYLFKTIFSEISKIIIMGILFFHNLNFYLFSLLVMLCLRCCTGGFHFYTYWQCLGLSIVFLFFPAIVLPRFFLPFLLRMALLSACSLCCYTIGPVPSKYRPPLAYQNIKRCRRLVGGYIIFYSVLIYLFPENPLFNAGFWIIILHTLQLMAAKARKEES